MTPDMWVLFFAGILVAVGRGGQVAVRRAYCTKEPPTVLRDWSDITLVLYGGRLIATIYDIPPGWWSALISLSVGLSSIFLLAHYIERWWSGDRCPY